MQIYFFSSQEYLFLFSILIVSSVIGKPFITKNVYSMSKSKAITEIFFDYTNVRMNGN